ncbi:HK97 gp10 family phage protein [Flavobacterium panici]|uniref:Uncharacterized protein n=1 Tax=Flavobacterium panici TaxID=2654843 RepID=A0A9N8P0G0_9FLAO|nr:HK97 gp10 family phage protein [Flavobacterium panici]CAC9972917.1 hypothetical protein FLAPXU55_00596 [Flavobacterium panici]
MEIQRKRRTKEQIEADKIIKEELLKLGEIIYDEAKQNSRVAQDTFYKTDRVRPAGSLNKAGGTLRDSINYRVESDTTLWLGQVYYGAYQNPNELMQSVDRHIDEATKTIVTQITEILIQPFTTNA